MQNQNPLMNIFQILYEWTPLYILGDIKRHKTLSMLCFQFSSVTQSCLTFCDPMDCSTPGSPVHDQLLELAETHVHRVGNDIKSSHPLSSPSPSSLIFPSIRVFSNESILHISWPKYWSFSFSISPSNEYLGLISFSWTGWISLQSKGLARVFSNITVQRHPFFSIQLSS